MRLVKIKNKYLYVSDNPNGNHTYAVYRDKETNKNRAVALTHLYIKDNNRFTQVKKGNIIVTKFKEFEVPSGVKNYYYDTNVYGGNIDLTDTKNVLSVGRRYISRKQSETIKNFATKRYYNGKYYKK